MSASVQHSVMRTYAAAMFDLSRGKQALLSIAQPGLGALIALGHVPPVRTLAIGLIAAATGYLAVFSLNDVLDLRVDRLALQAGKAAAHEKDIDVTFMMHPLARGVLPFPAALAWVLGLGSISAVLAWVLNPACFYLFAACVALEIAYCSMRSVSWLKTIVSGVMVGLGALAGWAAVAPLTLSSLWVFGFIALWEIAGRNLPNDLADVESDRRVGIKTVATVFGNRASSIATLAGALATMALVAALPTGVALRLVVLALAAWTMVIPAISLVRHPTDSQAAAYFNRASLLPALALLGALVLMLASGGVLAAAGSH